MRVKDDCAHYIHSSATRDVDFTTASATKRKTNVIAAHRKYTNDVAGCTVHYDCQILIINASIGYVIDWRASLTGTGDRSEFLVE